MDAFLTAKRAANLSPSTLTNYEMHLRGGRARIFLADHNVGSPARLTAEVLQEFQSELLSAGLSVALTHAYHGVWRNFAGFCIDRGHGTSLSILMVNAPRRPQKEPPIFAEDRIRRLGLATRCSRDRLIIATFLRTGLRRQELCTLGLTDLVNGPEGHFLRVSGGKRAKDRVVPLHTVRVKFSANLRR
ncbi:MAG: tyrosine-type recombinase/integrase [Candidatus Dormibacteria bacterium]